MRLFVEAIGLAGPGMRDWEQGRAILSGKVPYVAGPTVVADVPSPERRRMGQSVKLALSVGQQAFAASPFGAATTATVFTTSCGDGETLHRICESLATPEREVSPTRFHNSVHNAAAGYWGIVTGCMEASTSLCSHDASFGAGLLEALAQVASSRAPAALIAYDHPYPEPINAARQIHASFGVALVLAPQRTDTSIAMLDAVVAGGESPASRMEDEALEQIRAGVPAARSLPLLAAFARGAAASVPVELARGSWLDVKVQPCS